MFTVYVLYSEKHNKIYVGYTSNIDQRLLSHNELETKGFTLRYRPWKLIYTEVFSEKSKSYEKRKAIKDGEG